MSTSCCDPLLVPLMQFLEHYKLELARRRFGPAAAEKGGVVAGEESPAKKPRIDLDSCCADNSLTAGMFHCRFTCEISLLTQRH